MEYYDREKIGNLYGDFNYELESLINETMFFDDIYYRLEEEYGFFWVDDLISQFALAGIETIESDAYVFETLKNYFNMLATGLKSMDFSP